MNLTEYIDLLKHKGQIILQGPPGTGKTYTAKDIAEKLIFGSVSKQKKRQKIRLEASSQFALIQFHPAYTYEDFVRGIVAENEDGQISYVTKNKLFADFAAQAKENLINSNEEDEIRAKRILVEELLLAFADDVQEVIDSKGKYPLHNTVVSLTAVEPKAFRYTGDNWAVKSQFRIRFSDLIQAYLEEIPDRQGIKKSPNLSGSAKQHASYYIRVLEQFRAWLADKSIQQLKPQTVEPKKNYVLLIDEINRANLSAVLGELVYALEYRNEAVKSMYRVDDDEQLTIPENLFIIGTMNTADRSVGHIDYAIRRRFAFVTVLPNKNLLKNQQALALFDAVEALFSPYYLAHDFKKEEIQLGHSYFLCKNNKELSLKLHYEIIPILEEYVKDGIFLETAIPKIQELKQLLA